MIVISPQLGALLSQRAERQRGKRHDFLFTLKIPEAGLHAFRYFNASLLSSLRVPLKVIQERLGHASAGSLTLDIYTYTKWQENVEAAKLAGEQIEKAVDSVSLTAIQEEGPADANQQALVSA